MTVKIDSASSPTSAKTRMSFIREAEYEFIASLVDLCAEMIVKTREKSAKHRYSIDQTQSSNSLLSSFEYIHMYIVHTYSVHVHVYAYIQKKCICTCM